MPTLPKIVLPSKTPLEKAVAKRVRRGIRLLDKVTPGWWKPINPATLAVSDRSFCVFAQAKHSFKEGIVQVADAAVKQGVKGVHLLTGKNILKISGFKESAYSYRADYIKEALKDTVVDVFYYGFDVDAELKELAEDYSREAKGETTWARRADAWTTIDKAWHAVVVQKKALDAQA